MYRILELNPQLTPFSSDIDLRMELYRRTKKRLLTKPPTASDKTIANRKSRPDDTSTRVGNVEYMSLTDFANAHEYFGIHRVPGGWIYREWAPGAHMLYLTGDFNGWNLTQYPMTRLDGGKWELYLPGEDALYPGCGVKTVVDANMRRDLHLPLYIRQVRQDKKTLDWTGVVTDDSKSYPWTDGDFRPEEGLYIYEAHVGMSSEEGKIATYLEFADNVLPKIKDAGYNTLQLMAVMSHPYYGSFGYQVTNFFAAASWFGTPDDLKYLINKAHGMGIRVLLDIVHSHAAKNTAEGINMFDGTACQFFHDGEMGEHPAWDTKCFNYGKDEVLHFLLSDVKFWMNEYHFDGFRFDGVTSMLYRDHGLGESFDDDGKYFSLNTDTEAVTYLQLANELAHSLNPLAITIAEDMSGMPGMCLPIEDGGIGFDYRLGMGLPDMWIKTLTERRDEDWDIGSMWGEMCLRRPGEKTVAYVESHDQALVGDKTVIFRLADAAMYTDMDKICHNPVIDRAVALHKMIRLFTLAGGGEAYLNFMGNEFGHPEWIDFPREGNGWSFHYCRRQWSLADNGYLKYGWLKDFDRDMISLAKEAKIYRQSVADLLYLNEAEKIIAFFRTGVVFAFNFHPEKSREHVLIKVPQAPDMTVGADIEKVSELTVKGSDFDCDTPPLDVSAGNVKLLPGSPAGKSCDSAQGYELILSSDDKKYGGQDLIAHMVYPVKRFDGQDFVELYLPARCAVALRRVSSSRKTGSAV